MGQNGRTDCDFFLYEWTQDCSHWMTTKSVRTRDFFEAIHRCFICLQLHSTGWVAFLIPPPQNCPEYCSENLAVRLFFDRHNCGRLYPVQLLKIQENLSVSEVTILNAINLNKFPLHHTPMRITIAHLIKISHSVM